MKRTLLVAIDDSWHCSNIMEYLCLQFGGQPDIHFHLLNVVPCYLGDASRQWLDQQELISAVDPATRKKFLSGKQYVERVERKILEHGFHKDQVQGEVRFSRQGIAVDMIQESQEGRYDALVTGKRDLGLLAKVIEGSVSADILEKNRGRPIWIINGRIESQRYLVPVDCSPHTLNAVDHLAFILADNPRAEITLFHSRSLLAGEQITPKEAFYEKWGKEWCDEHLQGEGDDHFHFRASEQILKEAGFPMERVKRFETRKGVEPGQQIVQLIKGDAYGTIVMGRRGTDTSKGVFRGVSDRVLANVENVAVWIIG